MSDNEPTFSVSTSVPYLGTQVSNTGDPIWSNNGDHTGTWIKYPMDNTTTISNPWTTTQPYTIQPSNITSPNSVYDEIQELKDTVNKLSKLVGIMMDEPTTEQLEKHKALRDAYKKYKMIEMMILGDESESE